MLNFIPEFYQVLAQYPYETQMPKDEKREIWDDILQSKSDHKKSCWTYFEDWNKKQIPILVLEGNKIRYLLPKNTSIYPNYDGILIEVESKSFDYIKPSSLVRANGKDIKGKELLVKDRLNRRSNEQIIRKINQIQWKGNMFSLSFPVNVLLPVRYDSDYILIPCGVY